MVRRPASSGKSRPEKSPSGSDHTSPPSPYTPERVQALRAAAANVQKLLRECDAESAPSSVAMSGLLDGVPVPVSWMLTRMSLAGAVLEAEKVLADMGYGPNPPFDSPQGIPCPDSLFREILRLRQQLFALRGGPEGFAQQPPNLAKPKAERPVPPAEEPPRKRLALNQTNRRIITVLRRQTLQAYAVANRVGISHGYARRLLAALVRGGYLKSTPDGYKILRTK
jgi:hypothetical protein